MATVICLLLALLVFAVFGQTLRHGFVNYDDDEYVYANARVIRGLSWENVAWAFTHVHSNNWHPLTTLSHMLDCQLFGLNPAGPHGVNVLLHAAAAAVLFLVLRSMTGCLWRSAFVAAVFAIHPLRVESVAWVSERKDVLSGLFFMLTLWAYARYVGNAESRMQNAGREEKAGSGSFFTLRSAFSLPSYWLVVLLCTLGLLAKPMLVTLPLVLLLLDYWPLQRARLAACELPAWRRLFLEKVPLFVLVSASCVATIMAQRGALQSFGWVPPLARLSNAIMACVTYVGQMFWPANLAVAYPFALIEPWKVIASLAVLAGITAMALWRRESHPYLWTGWSWYLVMLMPVIGIVQVGSQARADRYTYLPLIGLVVALTWFVADLGSQRRGIRILAAVFAILALALSARHQVSFWKDSGSLWLHALQRTKNNAFAHNNLGDYFTEKGRLDEAIGHLQQALRVRPDFPQAHNNLGNALLQKGHVDEAIDQYRQALYWMPGYEKAYYNCGNALLQRGRVDEAIDHYQEALRLKADYADAHSNLGTALLQKGHLDEAIDQYRQALYWMPGYEKAYYNCGNALLQKGRVDEAIDHYRQALRLKPEFADAHNNLGSALLQKGRVDEAIKQYQDALRFRPDFPEACNNLGSAFLEENRLDEAIDQYAQALRLKPDFANAHSNLGNALLRKGRMDEAIEHYRQALQIAPNHAAACINLGLAWAMAGKTEEALAQYRKALRLQPNHVGLLNTLARELATTSKASLRNGVEAVEYAVQANEITGRRDPALLDTLAAAYAEAGRFPEAVNTAKQALQLAEEQSNSALAEALRREISLYESGNPLRADP